MRMLLLVAIVCLGDYALLASGDLDEEDVYTLSARNWDAFATGDRAAVCEFFHENFDGIVLIRTAAGDVKESANKHTACEGTVKYLATKETLEQEVGDELIVNVEYKVHDVTIDASG